MNDRDLRRECAALVKSLDLPRPFTIAGLVARLEELRGRPIEMVPMPMAPRPDSPCGLWVATRDSDIVMYSGQTTKWQQENIQRHELAHIAWGHDSKADPDMMARLLMPDLDPAFVRSILARTEYDTTDERKAETVARLLPLQEDRAGATDLLLRPDLPKGRENLAFTLGAALERITPRQD